MNEVFEALLNAPSYIQAFALMIFSLGLFILWKFKKPFIIVGMGFVSMYVYIKQSFGSEE
jgi:hypothetical protein